MAKNYKMYLGGEWVDSDAKLRVENPFDKSLVGRVALGDKHDFTQAIKLAHQAFAETRELPSWKRAEICNQIADGLEKSHEKFAQMMSREVGKALKDSRGEVSRAVQVFRVSAEEAKRVGGEIMDLDWTPGTENRMGLIRRFPIGVIAGIAPFNFPLNLVAHKIGPAIASGNPIVLKPAPKTPIIALMLAELIDQTDYPKGAISVMMGENEAAAPLLEDPRVKLITFTGSDKVGWWIKEKSGQKKVVLELGGNAGVAIADDADLDFATDRLVYGSFGQAGQSCISVQRIFVHEKVYLRFMRKFRGKTAKLKVGNPMNPKTDIGTMVNQTAIDNTVDAVNQAVAEGARVITGGRKRGLVYQPTILTNVKRSMDVCSKEVFAPVVTVEKYTRFKQVIEKINDSSFGLQAGVFTNRMDDVFYAFKHLDVGGVVVNDIPTFRADHQPYGGVKNSGVGREGIRYAMEDMTEIKILSMNLG